MIAGVLVLLATIVINRFLGERNYGRLTPDEKLRLTDAFSAHRSLGTYIPVGVMLAVLAVGFFSPQLLPLVFPVGVGLVLVVLLAIQVAVFRRLKELALPDSFVTRFRVQSTLVQLGNIVALSLLAYGIVARAM